LSREQLKRRILTDVIAKRKANARGAEYPSAVEDYFLRHFPSVYHFIRVINHDGWQHENLIRLLQREESRLGKVSRRAAEGIKYRVEQLLECLMLNRPMDAELAAWVTDLKPRMAKKLARVGLISMPDAKPTTELGPFLDSYIERRTDVSPHTRRIWRQTARHLVTHFGADRPLNLITRGDAADWRLSLVAGGLADASVRKHCGFAKHFFARAVDHELVPAAHVAAAWLGHSTLVSQKHYWQVTDADFARAIQGTANSGAESGAPSAQKTAQRGRATNRGNSHASSATDWQYGSSAATREIERLAAIQMAEVHGNRTHRTRGWRASRRF